MISTAKRKTRTVTTITARMYETSRLYLSGKTQNEIARELGVSQRTISNDLKKLRDSWLASSIVNINEAKALELAKIDNLELEYWEAWRRSIGESIRETARQSGRIDGSPEFVEIISQKTMLHGDPRFLQGIQWCIDKRCKIFGLDAPQQVEISWQSEIIDLLANGEIEPEWVQRDFGNELASELFRQAGIAI